MSLTGGIWMGVGTCKKYTGRHRTTSFGKQDRMKADWDHNIDWTSGPSRDYRGDESGVDNVVEAGRHKETTEVQRCGVRECGYRTGKCVTSHAARDGQPASQQLRNVTGSPSWNPAGHRLRPGSESSGVGMGAPAGCGLTALWQCTNIEFTDLNYMIGFETNQSLVWINAGNSQNPLLPGFLMDLAPAMEKIGTRAVRMQAGAGMQVEARTWAEELDLAAGAGMQVEATGTQAEELDLARAHYVPWIVRDKGMEDVISLLNREYMRDMSLTPNAFAIWPALLSANLVMRLKMLLQLVEDVCAICFARPPQGHLIKVRLILHCKEFTTWDQRGVE
ncbi:hypothetical protein FB45DRAFT_883286 [Roridomyces roridus]|uniref:Uncharacterized protein n=1 Tax=Roridomyces roridus TaxID=1738132 RepID=A0AAD7AXP5_9AGAR|nr:hypothetical protein FB45DRAFT_883286 [Roridomyces roridus]